MVGRGKLYNTVGPQSYYNAPIDRTPERVYGNSRIWGDASPEVQRRVIETLIAQTREKGLTTRETVHVLAVCRVKSEFNPDAAARTTSAYGLGQFVNTTAFTMGSTTLTDLIWTLTPRH